MNFTSRRNTHPTTIYDQATGRQIPGEEETNRKQETGYIPLDLQGERCPIEVH